MKTREQLVELGIKGFKVDEIMLLQEKMMEQAVKFQFVKKDGTIRDAVGTLVRKLMVLPDGSLWEPKGEPRPDVPSLMKFWDVEAMSWKCFNVLNLVSVEG